MNNLMQRPNKDSIYYREFVNVQKNLRSKIIVLRKSKCLVQEDMTSYELSVR